MKEKFLLKEQTSSRTSHREGGHLPQLVAATRKWSEKKTGNKDKRVFAECSTDTVLYSHGVTETSFSASWRCQEILTCIFVTIFTQRLLWNHLSNCLSQSEWGSPEQNTLPKGKRQQIRGEEKFKYSLRVCHIFQDSPKILLTAASEDWSQTVWPCCSRSPNEFQTGARSCVVISRHLFP